MTKIPYNTPRGQEKKQRAENTLCFSVQKNGRTFEPTHPTPRHPTNFAFKCNKKGKFRGSWREGGFVARSMNHALLYIRKFPLRNLAKVLRQQLRRGIERNGTGEKCVFKV